MHIGEAKQLEHQELCCRGYFVQHQAMWNHPFSKGNWRVKLISILNRPGREVIHWGLPGPFFRCWYLKCFSQGITLTIETHSMRNDTILPKLFNRKYPQIYQMHPFDVSGMPSHVTMQTIDLSQLRQKKKKRILSRMIAHDAAGQRTAGWTTKECS